MSNTIHSESPLCTLHSLRHCRSMNIKKLHDISLPESADCTSEDRDEYKVTGILNDTCHDKGRQKKGG